MDGTAILESASKYLYCEAQLARSEDEHEDFSISLKLLGLLCDWPGGPGIFNLACGYAVGLPHGKYLYRRAARAAFMRKESLRAIPDYDYSNETAPEDDPTDGRRKYHGNRFDRRCDLDTSPGSRHDATGIGCEDEDHAATDERMGDRANTYGRSSAPNRERATGRSSVPDAYRGSAPQRITSNAQKLALAVLHKRRRALATLTQRRRDVASYFGA